MLFIYFIRTRNPLFDCANLKKGYRILPITLSLQQKAVITNVTAVIFSSASFFFSFSFSYCVVALYALEGVYYEGKKHW